MASTESDRRQRALGGAIGVIVLALALVYHFFPGLLHVQPEARRVAPRLGTSSLPPMGFESRPRSRSPELDAGPPLSLAPSAVIAARRAGRPAPAASAASRETPESPQVAALLKRADAALAAGRLAGGEDSAATLYAQALDAKPDSARARDGLAGVRVRLVAAVEKNLAEGDADAAQGDLDRLDGLPGSGQEARRLRQSLQALQQVRPLLAHAAELLQQGHALQPDADNALAVYRKVLGIDPGNAVAHQGIARIQQQLLDKALAAVAQDDYPGADAALAQAAAIDPDAQALQDTRGRVEGIRRQRAESLLAQARSALDGGDQKLARQLRDQALAVSPDVPGIDAFNERLSNARLYANYKPGQVFSDSFVDIGGSGPRMTVIPTGTFMMGAADDESGREASETPQHEVHIAGGFAIGRTEVTVGQFRDFVRSSGYVPDSVRLRGASIYDERRGAMREDADATWEDDYTGRPAKDTDPVVNVSWKDAQAYASWLSRHTGKRYRLPSEAEFEYALRGGTTTTYWWGNGNPRGRIENLTGSGDRSQLGRRWTNAFRGYRDGYWGPAPVATFAANPFGLYDIDGNVSEWTLDCWHDNYTRAPHDGSAWVNPGCALRVIRGGSWGSSPEQVRSAYRLTAAADTRSGRVGFRVVREL